MISKEIPITVYHRLTGSHPPDGKDLREEQLKCEYARVGFQKVPEWVTEMLTALVEEENGLETGTKVRVTMEVVRTET